MKSFLKSLKRQKSHVRIAGILVLLFILFGIIFIIKNPPHTPPQKEYQLINLNQNGFSPQEISVKKGSLVVWMNKSGKDATVNSDPYPQNNKYPILQLGIFSNNQSLQTTFETAGTYTYHNQFSPKQTGKIIVTE